VPTIHGSHWGYKILRLGRNIVREKKTLEGKELSACYVYWVLFIICIENKSDFWKCLIRIASLRFTVHPLLINTTTLQHKYLFLNCQEKFGDMIAEHKKKTRVAGWQLYDIGYRSKQNLSRMYIPTNFFFDSLVEIYQKKPEVFHTKTKIESYLSYGSYMI